MTMKHIISLIISVITTQSPTILVLINRIQELFKVKGVGKNVSI